MSLTADIARLKAQLGEENRKRIIVFRRGCAFWDLLTGSGRCRCRCGCCHCCITGSAQARILYVRIVVVFYPLGQSMSDCLLVNLSRRIPHCGHTALTAILVSSFASGSCLSALSHAHSLSDTAS